MRIILKIIAAPFVLVLTLLCGCALVPAESFRWRSVDPRFSAGHPECADYCLGGRYANRRRRADHGLCHFAPLVCRLLPGGCWASWTISTTPCGASSQADTSGHGGQKMQKRRLTTAAVCHIREEGRPRPQPISNPISRPPSGRLCKSLKDRFDYGLNPEKLGGGVLLPL